MSFAQVHLGIVAEHPATHAARSHKTHPFIQDTHVRSS